MISEDFEILVNGNSIGNFTASPDDFTPVSYDLDTSEFSSGTNTIEIKGTYPHITGGYIKILYESDVTYEQPTRYYFPGIQGLINLYDGFYVPGDLTGLSISLHFNNSIPTFLTLGNTEIFNSSSDGVSTITIPNSTLSVLLNYSNFSRETIPIRFGMEDMDYLGNNSDFIDVFSATDISGSMEADCSGESSSCCDTFNCEKDEDTCEGCGGTYNSWWGFTWWSGERATCCEALVCNSNETNCETCGGVHENKIQDAKNANDLFIDMILNETDSRVGLTAYSTSALESN